jgi:hypothetical protein
MSTAWLSAHSTLIAAIVSVLTTGFSIGRRQRGRKRRHAAQWPSAWDRLLAMLVPAPGAFFLTSLALESVWMPGFDGVPASAWMLAETCLVGAMLAIAIITLWLWQRAGMVNLREGRAAWYGRMVPVRAAMAATSLAHPTAIPFEVVQSLRELGELLTGLLPRTEVGRHATRHHH